MRPPVVERLGDVLGGYLLFAREVGDGPCHPEYPVVPPPREPHPVHSPREEHLRVAMQSADLAQPTSGERRVGRALAPGLDRTRPPDALPYETGLFSASLLAQLLAREAWHVDEEVHPVEQRARDASLVAFDLARRAPANPPSVPRITAGAGVHGAKQRHPRGIGERRGHPRDRHLPILQRLAQGLERRPTELGQLVEEKHAVVCQRHLPWPRVAPTPCEPRGRYGVVRSPERPPRNERPVALPARAVDLGYLDALLQGERGQNTRHPACQHGLPGTGWPTHDHVVSTRGGHLQSPLGVSLPSHVGKVLVGLYQSTVLGRRFRRGDPRTIPEERHSIPEAPHPVNLYATDCSSLRRIPLRDDQAR